MSFFGISKQLGSVLRIIGSYRRPVTSGYVLHQYRTSSPYCSSYTQTHHVSQRIVHTSATKDTNISESQNNNVDKERRFNKKLHSRVLSAEEKTEIEQFRKSHQFNLKDDDHDVFGNFKKRGKVQDKESVERTDQTTDISEQSAVDRKYTSRHLDFHGPHKSQSRSVEQLEFKRKSRKSQKSDKWGDKFGTLQEDGLEDRIQESISTEVGSHEERFSDDEDENESHHIRLSKYNRRRIPEWYGRRILKLGKRGQIRQAIEVFEDWMLKQDRVMPNSYVFICIITVLGRAGYTKKAFSLFNKMKKMGIQPKAAVYTALFNACANSPWKNDGRTRAENLFHLMKEKEVTPTYITGKAMVKAFAICGDVGQAFSLMDELSQIYPPDPEAFSFLLMACISDREAGFRHAIQVWQLMHRMKVQPDLPLYNLLIRCIRDCGVGDIISFHTVLSGGMPEEQLQPEKAVSISEMAALPVDAGKNHDMLLREQEVLPREKQTHILNSESDFVFDASSTDFHDSKDLKDSEQFEGTDDYVTYEVTDPLQSQNTYSEVPPSSLTVHSSSATIPDVLSPVNSASRVISLGDLSTKENRLALLGGVDGILSQMANDNARPDIITFSQLISVAMPTVEVENELLRTMDSMKVKPDIDLINGLIHKRCMRKDITAAKAAKQLLQDYHLTANQRTYGVLAMTCKKQKDGAQLLEEMEADEMAPNMEIIGTLMYAAGVNFYYKLWVLRQAQKLDLVPNNKFLENVESSLIFARRLTIDAEKKKDQKSYFLSAKFQDSLEKFKEQYEAWLKEIKVEIPRHPWAAFRPEQKAEEDAAVA